MQHWKGGENVGNFIFAGTVAVLITFLLTPIARAAAIRFGLIDEPGERRINQRPVPSGGGLAIFAAFWATVLITGHWESELWVWLTASAIVVITGVIDDRIALRPGWKLIGQILAAVVFVSFGPRIEFLTNPFGGMIYLAHWSIPLTILWLVAVVNVVNFIDGLDGLAAGIAGIACITLTLIALQSGQPFAAILAFILGGTAFGFLPHNFNPARIFMGDSGSLFLGFMLGVISIEGALKGATAIALTIPVLVLGVPMFDAVFAIVRRYASGRPVYEADQGHVHHRLLALGFSHRQAVLTLYALGCLSGGVAILLLGMPTLQATGVFVVITLSALVAGRQIGLTQLNPLQKGSKRHFQF